MCCLERNTDNFYKSFKLSDCRDGLMIRRKFANCTLIMYPCFCDITSQKMPHVQL